MGSGPAEQAHLAAGQPGLHVPELGHLEAVHGGRDRLHTAWVTRESALRCTLSSRDSSCLLPYPQPVVHGHALSAPGQS